MRLIYIDDSADEKSYVFSALCVHDSNWKECFDKLRDLRRNFRARYGVLVRKEFHATDFVAGRGDLSTTRKVTKFERATMFRENIQLIAELPNLKIINACGPKAQRLRLFERMLNRINILLRKSEEKGLLIVDEGSESEYLRLARKMGVYNPIPSKYGKWIGDASRHSNLPINEIVEDPFFKDSRSSFFLQAADFVAFSLLRNENQLPSRNKYGIQECFPLLEKVLVKEAYGADPRKLGIIRA